VRMQEECRSIVPHPEAVRTLDASRLIPENGRKGMLMRPRATRTSMASIVTGLNTTMSKIVGH